MSNTDCSVAVRLSPRARVVVAARPDHHIHALRQLRRYLADCPIEVVGADELARVMPTLSPESVDLLVVLADSVAGPPEEMVTSEEIETLEEDAFVLRTGTFQGRPALVAVGGGTAGLIHAVNELGTQHLSDRTMC